LTRPCVPFPTLIFVLHATLAAVPLTAQQGRITGRVTDAGSNQGLVGARLQVLGTSLVATTAQDGRYVLANVPAGSYELRAFAVGYAPGKQTVTLAPGQSVTLDLALTAVPVSLEEIVITATGEQRKLVLGHTVASVRADSIVPYGTITNLGNLLQGRAAGVAVLPSSGSSGTGTRIRIRGANSVSLTNEPLVVIDGAYTPRGTSSLTIGTGGQAPSRLNDLNPEDIESIEVVKGPAAATLYGGDAASGVILVTTRKGRAGKAQWNAWIEQGLLQDQNSYPDNYRSYGRALVNGTPTGNPGTCLLDAIGRGVCAQDSLTTLNPLMDPVLTPIGNGRRAQYGLSASGGSEAVRYFVSGEYASETGTFKLPDYERQRLLDSRNVTELEDWTERPNTLDQVSLRANLNATPSSRTDLAVNVGYVSSTVRLPQNDNNVLGMLPSGYFGRGSAADTSSPGACGPACGSNSGWGFYKPGEIFTLLREQGVERFTSSVQGNARPASWLALRATLGYDVVNETDYAFNPTGLGPPFSVDYTEGRLDDNRLQSTALTVDLGASASARLGGAITSRTSAGFQFVDRRERDAFAAGRGIPAGLRTITGAATQFASSLDTRLKSMGLFLEEQLTFDDRLFLTAGLRMDDASSIGRDYDITFFPKVSVSWLMSEEDWFPRGDFLNLFRLRGAYGNSGLYPRAFDALVYLVPTTAAVGGVSSSAITVGGLGVSNLQPERSTEWELGVDAGLWRDKVSLELTYYSKTSRDALINRVLAPSLGVVPQRFENLGRVQNRGIEAGLFAQPVRASSVTWDFSVTGSLLDNELLELGTIEGEPVAPIVFDPQRHVPGFPLGGYWSRPYTYADKNGDGIIDRTEVTMAPRDSVIDSPLAPGAAYLGSVLPRYEASLNTTLGFFGERLRIGARMDYLGGHRQYNRTEVFRCTSTGNNCRGIHDPGAPLDEQARAVVARILDPASVPGYLEDASFAKLREVSVTYTIPDRWARALRLGRVTATAAGRNLLTITGYSGVDPEVNAQGQTSFGTQDFLTQPSVRSFIFRLNVGF
jgi:TonB-linked SusC/RagA family outer membrane protein